MQEGQHGSVFEVVASQPITVIPSKSGEIADAVAVLGYQELADNLSEHQAQVLDVISGQIPDIIDAGALMDGDKIALERRNRQYAPRPTITFCERDGQECIQAHYSNDLSILLDYPIDSRNATTNDVNVGYVFPVRSVLVRGEDGSQLDLVTLNPQNEAQFFTFGFLSPYHRPARRDGEEGAAPSYVLFGLQTVEPVVSYRVTSDSGVTWNERFLRHVLLHEYGHAETNRDVIKDQDAPMLSRPETVRDERGANAYALAVAHRIDRDYPEAHFFDVDYLLAMANEGLASYEENYLVDDEGYLWLGDGGPTIADLPLTPAQHFTDEARRQVRYRMGQQTDAGKDA